MISRSVPVIRGASGKPLPDRIAQLQEEKVRLLDEWRQAMKRICRTPAPHRKEALQVVGKRYSDLADTLEAHIRTLQSLRGKLAPQGTH